MQNKEMIMRRYLSVVGCLLVLAVDGFAFDFGSLTKMVSPMADSAISESALGKNPLVQQLVSSLGVTPTQAIGGSAALMNEAKKDMKSEDFSALTKSMPSVGSLASAAPTSTLPMAEQFEKLGLSSSMVEKFTPIVLEYVKSGTTPSLAKLFEGAIK